MSRSPIACPTRIVGPLAVACAALASPAAASPGSTLAPMPLALEAADRQPAVDRSHPMLDSPVRRKPPVAARRSPASDPERQVGAANELARMQPVETGFANAIQRYAFSEGALFQVYARPGQVTDLVLQEGEKLVGPGPVASGDTARWLVGDTLSGSGDAQRVHILVKPTRPDIATNLVINTDRRTYHLELRASARVYMAAVSWTYPEDELIALRKAEVEAARTAPIAGGFIMENLNFDYRISGDRPVWRPLRVFDDGRQTLVEFPPAIARGELPPFFAIGEGGEAELVNYRVNGRYLIVDRVLHKAELRLGAGRRQLRVTIVNRAVPRP